jgi:acetyl-CoA synthetase
MNFQIKTTEEYQAAYNKSVTEPEAFWADIANQYNWRRKWDKALEWNFEEPNIQWFQGGKLNISENCLDRHLEQRGNKLALIWEPNDPK